MRLRLRVRVRVRGSVEGERGVRKEREVFLYVASLGFGTYDDNLTCK